MTADKVLGEVHVLRYDTDHVPKANSGSQWFPSSCWSRLRADPWCTTGYSGDRFGCPADLDTE